MFLLCPRKKILVLFVWLLCLPLVSPFSAFGAEQQNKTTEPKFMRYQSCNWLVTYRNRTYDLSPLTRSALPRNIEGDLSPILQRVPKSKEALQEAALHSKRAKTHAIIASFALTAALISRIVLLNTKNPSSDMESTSRAVTLGGILFFAGGTYFSLQNTRQTKELVNTAIEAFNKESPHPVEPLQKGDQ